MLRFLPLTFYLHAAIRKIKYQFPDSSEGRLMAAVVAQAIMDLSGDRVTKSSAIRYLQGDIFHAQIAGVSPDWIRAVLTQCGVHFELQRDVVVKNSRINTAHLAGQHPDFLLGVSK